MAWLLDFTIQSASGLVGVFVGVVLALWVERVRERSAEDTRRQETVAHLADVRRTILSSVVKNASEAKRVMDAQERTDADPYLWNVAFETAVWEATRAEFVRLASLDERIQFTRFFDRVARLSALVDFSRRTRADLEMRQAGMDAGDGAFFARLGERLREAAEDARLDGIVLVTDHGEPVHRRLLGIRDP